jgi:TPR repeat protein
MRPLRQKSSRFLSRGALEASFGYAANMGAKRDVGSGSIRWLFLAADKGHLQAEALLGQTLFTGREDVRPQRALGLM